MKLLKYFSLLLLSLLFACQTEEDLPFIIDPIMPDYFVFGDFYGLCEGEQCIDYFKIEEGTIYEDTEDNYPNGTESVVTNWLPTSSLSASELDFVVDAFPS